MMFFSTCLDAQIPIEKFRKEISQLKSESEKDAYWQKLHKTDQDTLLRLPTDNITNYDSLSTSLMIKTVLMFNIHGIKVYKKNNTVPILNFTHNYIGEANLIFWPIIAKCLSVGGYINTFATGFPAYQLEAISNNFYKYSLVGKKEKYAELVQKLDTAQNDSIIPKLEAAYQRQKQLRTLGVIDILGNWYEQPFKNLKEEYCFQIVRLSDQHIYIKHGGYLQKLILLGIDDGLKKYKIENEPFDWCYQLDNENRLKLLDQNNSILIEYSQCN